MTFSEADRAEVLKMAAQILADKVIDGSESLDDLIVIPLIAASQFVGLSTKQIGRRLPVTVIGPKSHGITLRTMREYIASNTRRPEAAKQPRTKKRPA